MNNRSGTTIWVPYVEAQLEILIRSAVRGRNTLALTKQNSRTIDSFQHIEDEASRLLRHIREDHGTKTLEKETQRRDTTIRL